MTKLWALICLANAILAFIPEFSLEAFLGWLCAFCAVMHINSLESERKTEGGK